MGDDRNRNLYIYKGVIDLLDYACLSVIGMLFGSLKDGNFDKFCRAVGREPSPRVQAIYNLAKGRFVNVDPVLDKSEGTAVARRLIFKVVLDGAAKGTRIVVDMLNNQGSWYVSAVLWIPPQSHPMVLLGEYQAGELEKIARSVRGSGFLRYTNFRDFLSSVIRAKVMRPVFFIFVIGLCAYGTYTYVNRNAKSDTPRVASNAAKSGRMSAGIPPKADAKKTVKEKDSSSAKQQSRNKPIQHEEVQNVASGTPGANARQNKPVSVKPNIPNNTKDPVTQKQTAEIQKQQPLNNRVANDKRPLSSDNQADETTVKVIQAQTQAQVQAPRIEVNPPPAQVPNSQGSQKAEQPQAVQELNAPAIPEMPGSPGVSGQ